MKPATAPATDPDERPHFEARVANGEFTADWKKMIDGLERIYTHGDDEGDSTGWIELDKFYTVKRGEMCIITGVPSHGKSAFVDCLAMNLARDKGYKFSLFSPENKPYALHLRKLIEIHAGMPLRKKDENTQVLLMPTKHMAAAVDFIHGHFMWVDLPSPSLPDIIAVWTDHILNHGVTACVLDPWNEVEHHRPDKTTETEYISLCLSSMREFARLFNVALFVVAHPAKLQRAKDGTYPVPSLWDISGSAHWRAKADVGIVIHRRDITQHNLDVHIQKVRFKTTGKPGTITLNYHYPSGRMYE